MQVVEKMCVAFGVKQYIAFVLSSSVSSFSYHSKHGVLLLSQWSHQIEAVTTLRRAILKSHLDQESSSVLSHRDMGVVCYCSISLA